MGSNISILEWNVRNPLWHLKEELYLTKRSPLPKNPVIQSFGKGVPILPSITVLLHYQKITRKLCSLRYFTLTFEGITNCFFTFHLIF